MCSIGPKSKKVTHYFGLAKFSCHGTCLKFFSTAIVFSTPPRCRPCSVVVCPSAARVLSVLSAGRVPSPCTLPRHGFDQFLCHGVHIAFLLHTLSIGSKTCFEYRLK
jgi:hypothetical protein